MKIALTVWDGWVSPVFDVCRQALVLEIDSGDIVSTSAVDLHAANPRQKTERLVDLGVETLICGAISEPVQREATTRDLTVIGFVAGQVDEVVEAFVAGRLPSAELSMPGCGGRRRRIRGGGGGGRGKSRGRHRNRR